VAEPVTAEVSLEGVTASVPAAREFVRALLQSWRLGALAEAVELVVSELATNAVLHAHSGFTVRLSREASGGLRLEVVDGSARTPVRRTSSATATTGRGLALVQGLSSAWGVDVVTGGKSVWVQFEAAAGGSGQSSGPGWSGGLGQRFRAGPAGPLVSAA
jgi:anti-sigma regulatory factor (Ser/Thr protein kinase)